MTFFYVHHVVVGIVKIQHGHMWPEACSGKMRMMMGGGCGLLKKNIIIVNIFL